MIRKNQTTLNAVNMVLDAILIFLSYLLATYIRFGVMYGKKPALWLAWNPLYLKAAALYAVLLVATYYAFKLYGSYRFQSQIRELSVIVAINAAGVSALTGFLYITRVADFSRLAIFFFFILSTVLVAVKRICLRALLRRFRKLGYNQKHVVVVGDGHFARQYIEDIKARPYLGFVVDGYVSKIEKPGLGHRLGEYEELEKILENREVDELIVALEPHEVCFMEQVYWMRNPTTYRLSVGGTFFPVKT